MSFVSATSHRAAAAAAGILFLAAAMHQHVAGAAPAAAVHHVVGGYPGWAVASDVPAWSAGRLFTVGVTLWFAYEAAEDGVAEFEPGEAGDPIRTYTDGLSRVGLDDEGTRYFLSADPAKCKGGLKLRATVSEWPRSEDRAAAAAPAPSASSGIAGAPCVVSGLRVVLSVPGCMNTTIVLCLIGL